MSEYYCKLHQDLRVTEDEHGKGFTHCPKCNADLTPIVQDIDTICVNCGRNTKLQRDNLKYKIYGTCQVCKTIYSVYLPKPE